LILLGNMLLNGWNQGIKIGFLKMTHLNDRRHF
jgi:hypothetical protein